MKVTKKRKAILKLVMDAKDGSCTRRRLFGDVSCLSLTCGSPATEIKLLVDHGFLREDGTTYVITEDGREATKRPRSFYHTLNGKDVRCNPNDPCAPKKIRRKGLKQKYVESQRREDAK